MANQNNGAEDRARNDLFARWKEMQTAGLESWAKVMRDAVASDDFARAMGQYLDGYLQASLPVRRQVEAAMERYLEQVNLPSRGELTGLAERLTNLELRLDDLDAKVDEVLDRLNELQAAIKPPARRAAQGSGVKERSRRTRAKKAG